jgi:peptide/nickel transport system substrate-binding protein
MKKSTLSFVLLLLCSVLLLSACSGKTATTGSPAQKDTLTIASLEIPNALDPMKPLSASHLRRLGAIEGLFKVDPNGKVLPELAESSKQIDARTWEIKLRSGVKFWSGKALDAEAVIQSLEQSKADDKTASAYLKELTFAKKDDTTITVKTARDNVQVPLNLSSYQTLIHNADATYETVATADFTGMYKITDFQAEKSITLEINDSYWGTKPAIKKIVNNQVVDEQSRVLLAKSSSADIVTDIPVTGIADLKTVTTVRLTNAPSANAETIYFNLKQPQLQDVRVRQALSWALDREELVTLGAEGQTSPITTWLGANPAYPDAKNAVYSTKADTAKAGSLLDEAGWKAGPDGKRTKNGTQLKIRLFTWGNDKALGEAIHSEWTKLGIDAEVKFVDYSVIEDARKSGDWDSSIEAWSTFGDPYTLMSGQFSPKGSANYGGYDNSDTNALLEELAAAADDASRNRLALELNEQVAIQAPVVCIYARPQIAAVSASLGGFADHFRQFEYIAASDLKFNS